MRYGTVPLVRETGGLADTVTDFDEAAGTGNGFMFSEYSSDALFASMKRAIKSFKNKKAWKQIVENGAQCDFSWNVSARKYIDLYRNVSRKEG